MINLCIINGSPKISDSNSDFFIKELISNLSDNININKYYVREILKDSSLLKEIVENDKILIVSPLYADSFPSITLNFLELFEDFLEKNAYSKIEVYGIINCGFFEGKQNRIALNILEHFCNRNNLIWKFGLGIGGGEYFPNSSKTPEKMPTNKSLYSALSTLREYLENNNYNSNSHKNILLNPDKMTASFFRLCANIGWYISSFSKLHKISRLRKKIY